MPRTIVLVLSFLIAPLAARADQQPAADVTGQPVYVRQAGSTSEVRGQLLQLGPQTLALLVGDKRVELPLDSVERIDVAGDSLKNGALIGALVLGGWCAVICGQGTTSGGMWLSAVAINTGLGALIGTGIDALRQGRSTIYRQPSSSKRIAFHYGLTW